MKTLTVKQPWAWLIVNGHKDIENRAWRTNIRGPVLIHAAKTFEHEAWRYHLRLDPIIADAAEKVDLMIRQCGHVIGQCIIADCVTESDSPWFFGPYGFRLKCQKPWSDWERHKAKGRLGFWEYEADYVTT